MAAEPTRRVAGSIRLRAAVLTSVLIAIALVGVIAFTFFAIRESLIRAGEARAGAAAIQLAQLIGAPLPGRLIEVNRLVDHPAVRAALTTPSAEAEAEALARLKPVMANAQQHQTLELWTTAGTRVLAQQLPAAGSSVPLSDAAPTTTGILPYAVRGGVVVLDVVVPVRESGEGSPVIGHLLSRRLATNTNSNDALNRLIGSGGRVMVGNQSGSVWTDISKQVEGPSIDVSTPGTQRYVAAGGESRLAGIAHVDGTPFAIVVDFPQTLVIAPAWSLLRMLSLVGLVFIVIAVAIVWRLSATVTRPLNQLTDAIGAISAGNYSRRVTATQHTEVGQLGDAFNTMAQKIQTGLEELEAQARVLRDQDQRRAAMMNAALDGILTVNAAGRITECNPAAARVFGYDPDDILTRDLEHLLQLPDYGRSHSLEAYLMTAKRLELNRRIELPGRRRDGAEFPAEVSLAVVPGDDGPGLGVFVRDLTEQRAGEQSMMRGILLEEENRRVIEASRLKSEFLANMSHELRTPLNAIIGFAELLYDGQVTPDMPEFRDFMHDILTSGKHLLQLINDVLDLSKVEAGRLEFHPEQTDLAQVISESVGILRTLSVQKHITVTQQVDASLGGVFVDRARLKQVLYNYLSNAIKFTPEAGQIDVRAVADGTERFRIEVRDTGIGISPADQQRLFIEFNQLEAGAAKKHQGTGLGLALTKRLIEAQGGSVGVTSAPGSGSTFFAVLPRMATTGTPIAGPRSISSPRLGAPSVLVVEDDAADQEAIVSALVGAGFNVETATTRVQANAKLQSQTFDAITLDLILPDANGADILRDLRASHLNRDVPVVVITVVAGAGAVAGFAVHDILTKPVDGGGLLAALQRAGVSANTAGSVLVVDDDPGSLRLMAASLTQLGFASTCVQRAAEGLRVSERQAPLAVVLDLQMPEMDGFVFLEHFRKLPHCRQTPVIVWTVKDLTQDDYARLRSSVQGVLAKGQAHSASVVDELRRFTANRQVTP